MKNASKKARSLGATSGSQRQKWRSRHAAIVESDDAVAVGEAVELRLPRLSRIAQPRDQQHIRALSTALDPQLDVADRYPLAHHGLLVCIDWTTFLNARQIGCEPIPD